MGTGGAVRLAIGMLAFAAAAGATPEDVSRLSWMRGCWTGAKDGVAMEEHWTSAAGGALVGMHKDVKDGRMLSFEFFRVERGDHGVCYLSSPKGAPATPFCAIEIGAERVVFENLEHDFPQRILYWLDAERRLHARIEGELRGQAQSEEWVWRRSPDC